LSSPTITYTGEPPCLPGRYDFFISDHGTGLNGIAHDVTNGNDWIAVRELSDALSAVTENNGRLDILFADSCLMGMLEYAYQIRSYANFYIASENQSWITPNGASQPYPSYLAGVGASTTPEDVTRKIVTEYAAWLDHAYPGRFGYTLSAVDLSKIDLLVTATGALASGLKAEIRTYGPAISAAREAAQKFDSSNDNRITSSDEYVDLYDSARQISQQIPNAGIQNLAQGVMDTTDSYVVDGAEIHRSGSEKYPGLDNSHGVSIFLPRGDFKRSFYTGLNLDFAADATWGTVTEQANAVANRLGWGSMLVSYVEQQTPNAPDNPTPPALAEPGAAPASSKIYLPLVVRSR
jgi:hypothetical protein